MRKILAIALFAVASYVTAFGLVGTVAAREPAALGVSGVVAQYAPSAFGVAGAIASHETAFGVVGAAFADVPPPPTQTTPPPATPAAEMAPADVQKWLTFFDKLVVAVVNTQTTCDKMATDVNAVVDANKDALATAKKAKQQGKKLPADAKAKMVEGVKKMMPGMQNCGTNDKVRAAFAKLDLNH
ncbi:MAG TPA: hypothetical protein VL326_31855 [Kofleriaceae bacterium]|jgi:hypothetical protein|nr:hypothetical protein [Kofleriaceae bacterium]